MNFNFRKLRKIASSLVVSGILACSGGSVVNGLCANSINTACWGIATAVSGFFTGTALVAPGALGIEAEDSGIAALVSGFVTVKTGLQTKASSDTSDVIAWFHKMRASEEKRDKEIEQLQASMRNYSHSFQSAVLNSSPQPIYNVNPAMAQQGAPMYNACPSGYPYC